MPYLPTAQAWLTQSALLLQARPTSARITTKYTLSAPSTKKSKTTTTSEPATIATIPTAGKANLTLKTYDPVSGTTLKYKTDKAAEVGRLVLSLSRLGREMAGLPELAEEDVKMEGTETEVKEESGTASLIPAAPAPAQGGKSKKKKGKK